MNYISNIVSEIERWFECFNNEYFENELKMPIFTIQKARANNYGHFTLGRIWKNKDDENDSNYEINLAAHSLHRDVNDIAGTVLHEAIHQYHTVNGIKDCNGNIHNKKFKNKAEELGFIVTHSKQCGYGHTEIDGKLKTFISDTIKPNEGMFTYARSITETQKEKKPRVKKTFAYKCPECENTAKAKEDSNLKCGDCNLEMEIQE